MSEGPMVLGGVPDVFFLPGSGGAAQFVAMNPATLAVDASFDVAPTDDRSGDWGFVPEGGTFSTPSGDWVVAVDYPGQPAASGEVETREWDLNTGVQVG